VEITDKGKSYDQLSTEFRATVGRAYQLVPLMYNRLRQVEELSHKDACNKMYNDHKDIPGFSLRNIYRYLPSDNPNVPKRVVPPRHKPSGTENNVVPELSPTKPGSHFEEYFGERSSIEYDRDWVEKQELEEIKKIPDTSSLVRTEYRIRREKFEILGNALSRTREVCYVLFDSSGELVKADADTDR
jgi:hypothetical protein